MWLVFLASNSCSYNAKVKICCSSCYYYYYIIINNVLGSSDEDSDNINECLMEEKKTPIVLERHEKNVRNVRKITIYDSGNVIYMKLRVLYNKNTRWCSLHCVEITFFVPSWIASSFCPISLWPGGESDKAVVSLCPPRYFQRIEIKSSK
jgi:hypothetical protein